MSSFWECWVIKILKIHHGGLWRSKSVKHMLHRTSVREYEFDVQILHSYKWDVYNVGVFPFVGYNCFDIGWYCWVQYMLPVLFFTYDITVYTMLTSHWFIFVCVSATFKLKNWWRHPVRTHCGLGSLKIQHGSQWGKFVHHNATLGVQVETCICECWIKLDTLFFHSFLCLALPLCSCWPVHCIL